MFYLCCHLPKIFDDVIWNHLIGIDHLFSGRYVLYLTTFWERVSTTLFLFRFFFWLRFFQFLWFSSGFDVSSHGSHLQVVYFVPFLENITNEKDRRVFLLLLHFCRSSGILNFLLQYRRIPPSDGDPSSSSCDEVWVTACDGFMN